MPYSVEYLLNDQSKLVTVLEDDKAAHALDCMIDGDFSQLPVVDKEDRLVGIVTYESIMQGSRSFSVKVDELHVRDVTLTNIKSFDIEDNLFDLLDEIKKNNAVVIVEPDSTPIGIVTSYDSAEFLRSRSEGLMRVENIELTMKSLILACYSNKDGQIDEKKLSEAIQNIAENKQTQYPTTKQKEFNDLTMNDYVQLLSMKATWDFYDPILKIKREALIELLNKVRTTRNDLAHFRNEISSKARKDLVYCAEWLEKRFEEYQSLKAKDKINLIIEEYQLSKKEPEVTDPINKPGRKSVYAALADWLKSREDKVVLLTFETVEGIIKRPLPDSALELRSWWANDRVGHYHSQLWLDAGWRVDTVSMQEKWVRFVRAATVRAG